MIPAICWTVIAGVLLLYCYATYKHSIKGIALALIISVIALLATTSGAFVILAALGLFALLGMTAYKTIR
jgi:hypothetical protein